MKQQAQFFKEAGMTAIEPSLSGREKLGSRPGSRPNRAACFAAVRAALWIGLGAASAFSQQEARSPFPMTPPAQDGAVLNGRVLDAEGKPVMGVTIFTSRIDAQTDSPLTIGRERTGIDGHFSLSGLGPATYRLCIDPEGKQYLDPCEWSEEPVTVQLERNGLIQNLEVLVEDADIVTIEVEDQTDALGKFAHAEAASAPTGAGSKAPTAKAQGALILGLRTRTGNLSMARLWTADKQTKKLRYMVPAPKGEDLDFLLMPVGVDLRDSAARMLAERGSVTRVTDAQRREKNPSVADLTLTLERKVATP